MSNKELIRRTSLERIAGVAGTIAGAMGASAAGSTVFSVLGVSIVAATPVGWILGGAALGGAALYGGSKILGAKGVSDGDAKAHGQFNSEADRKQYMKLACKLSRNDFDIAKELLSKLPSERSDFAKDMLDGLEKGTMEAVRVITMCCKLLDEDTDKYLSHNDFTLDEIQQSIKIAILMALSDGEITEHEIDVIRKVVLEFFELSKVLDESETDLIFAQAMGTDEQQEQLKAMKYEEIQVLFVVFFLRIQNDSLKNMLLDFLAEIADADGKIDGREEHLYGIFLGLAESEKNLHSYEKTLKNLSQSTADFLFSNQKEDANKSNKKIKNALNSYAKGISQGMVVSLYDSTFFGKADEGFIVTPYAIITTLSDKTRVLPLGSIYKIEVTNMTLTFISEADEDSEAYPLAELICATDDLKDFINFVADIIEINTKTKHSNYTK